MLHLKMGKIKIDFRDIKFKDLNGVEIVMPVDYTAMFANEHWKMGQSIAIDNLCRKIHKAAKTELVAVDERTSESFEIDEEELKLLSEMFEKMPLIKGRAVSVGIEYFKSKTTKTIENGN